MQLDYNLMVAFLILLNPVALFMYLRNPMETLNNRDFIQLLVNAHLISFGVYAVFAYYGQSIFVDFFKINFNSFRVFGGIVIFTFSYLFVIKGNRSMIDVKEDIGEMASQLAMPFMVGAGTISVSILIGEKSDFITSALHIALALLANFVILLILKWLKDLITREVSKSLFDKLMGIMMRVLAFMVGAIGVDMVYTGVKNLVFAAKP